MLRAASEIARGVKEWVVAPISHFSRAFSWYKVNICLTSENLELNCEVCDCETTREPRSL